MLASTDFVVWNKEFTLDDKNEVGIELASLGEVANQEIDVIPEIIITPNAYQAFITGNNLSVQIKHLLGSINHERHDSLTQISTYISKHIETGVFPEKIATDLFAKLKKLDSHTVTLRAYYFYGKKQYWAREHKGHIG
jgi:phosphoenolpyruvate synthase/pyruvate phosphate dikinase